jgi:hypothetical protein
MENFDLNQIYSYIDRYAQLNFLVRILTSPASKNPEDFNSNVFDIDFNELGLSDEAVRVLSENPNIVNLKKYRDEIFSLAEAASVGIFGHMVRLSNEDKMAVKEYVDGMIAAYLTKVTECQETYFALVVEIDKSTKEENSAKTRSLGKMAKASFNKLYEYQTICQNYSNVSSYLRGMIKNRGLS